MWWLNLRNWFNPLGSSPKPCEDPIANETSPDESDQLPHTDENQDEAETHGNFKSDDVAGEDGGGLEAVRPPQEQVAPPIGAGPPSLEIMLRERIVELETKFDNGYQCLDQQFNELAGKILAKVERDDKRNDQQFTKLLEERKRLAEELTDIRQGLYDQKLKTFIESLFPFHDHLVEVIESTEESSNGYESTLKRLLQEFLDAMEAQGVRPYKEQSDRFDNARQWPIDTIAAERPEQDRLIAERIRQGFEREGIVLRPEWVKVYKFTNHGGPGDERE